MPIGPAPVPKEDKSMPPASPMASKVQAPTPLYPIFPSSSFPLSPITLRLPSMESKLKLGKQTETSASGDEEWESCNTRNTSELILLPALPNHLSSLCLTCLPPFLLFSVCHAWRRLIYSPSFPPFYCLYALLSQSSNPPIDCGTSNSVEFFALDPISSRWQSLPAPPRDPLLHLLRRHPSFLSRNLPIQSLTVNNHLVLVAGTAHQNGRFVPALSRPLMFHPESNQWMFGPPFSIARRWCVKGSLSGVLYLASGIGSHYQGDVARSMEQWVMTNKIESWKWEKMAALKDGRFSREAVDAVGYKGKLCMVNVQGNAAKEGRLYDVEANRWEEMPRGMRAGWAGPAATMNEEAMYAVDEVNGVLSEYNGETDSWNKVIELPEFRAAEQIAAGRGRVCVVCANGERILVVDVVARPARVWMVEPPHGLQVVSVHILPRMIGQQD